MSRHQSFMMFLLGLILCICIGCISSPNAAIRSGNSKPACKIVSHSLGQTCVPLAPQRIVVTDEITLDAVLALGIRPIAAVQPDLVGGRGRHLSQYLDDIVSIGQESGPSLERLVQLHPDLILGFNSARTHYISLARIAPTVALKYNHIDWQADLQQIGELLNQRDRAENQLAHYRKRVVELQAAMGDRLQQTTVSVVRFMASAQNTHYRTVASFPGSVLEDVGLSRPTVQQQPSNQPYGDVSLERIDWLDGDVIFTLLDPRSENSFQQFQNHRLWQTLSAVKANRVYPVDSGYWSFGNILAANAILDDLFRYLLPHD
jgi:iron complex transport system substrate-binding protein